MAYRNDDEVLRERYRTLEGELSQMKESREVLAGLEAREAKVREEMAVLTRSIARARPRRAGETPLLANLRIASPCPAKWDDMTPVGSDERTRFCSGCKKNVHNLSALDAAEAEALLGEAKNGELCVRYYQRADGTVMTQDCPDGVRRRSNRRLAVLAAGAFGLTASAFGAFASFTSMGSPAPQESMGGIPVMAKMGEPMTLATDVPAPEDEPPPPRLTSSTIGEVDPGPAPIPMTGRVTKRAPGPHTF